MYCSNKSSNNRLPGRFNNPAVPVRGFTASIVSFYDSITSSANSIAGRKYSISRCTCSIAKCTEYINVCTHSIIRYTNSIMKCAECISVCTHSISIRKLCIHRCTDSIIKCMNSIAKCTACISTCTHSITMRTNWKNLYIYLSTPFYKTMKETWQKIETWAGTHTPGLLNTLNPGASAVELPDLQRFTGVVFPEDFTDFLSVHNGQQPTPLCLFNDHRLLSIDEMISSWQICNSILTQINEHCMSAYGKPARSTPDAGIKNDWWNMAWLPFTADASRNHYCIDMDPAPDGTKGQIIHVSHNTPQRKLVSPSFREWISTYTNDLQQGVDTTGHTM